MLSPVFKPFVEESPVSVMARAMMERVLNPDQLNEWFDSTANQQYTKDLLFSFIKLKAKISIILLFAIPDFD